MVYCIIDTVVSKTWTTIFMKCDSTDILHFAKKQKTCLLKDILKYCQINSWHGVKYSQEIFTKTDTRGWNDANLQASSTAHTKKGRWSQFSASQTCSFIIRLTYKCVYLGLKLIGKIKINCNIVGSGTPSNVIVKQSENKLIFAAEGEPMQQR